MKKAEGAISEVDNHAGHGQIYEAQRSEKTDDPMEGSNDNPWKRAGVCINKRDLQSAVIADGIEIGGHERGMFKHTHAGRPSCGGTGALGRKLSGMVHTGGGGGGAVQHRYKY